MYINIIFLKKNDFPGGSDGKASVYNVKDLGSIPGLGRSPGGGHGNHFSILAWRISMDRGAWQTTVHGVAKSWTQLSDKHTILGSAVTSCLDRLLPPLLRC